MDLYRQQLGDVPFSRLRDGNQDNDEMESCVEIAPIPGVDDAYALRDSKNPDAGTLRFSGAELRAAGVTTI
ncbi:DUF397 domain-containing protein [Nonomuraea sp. NPDC050153]|uniref:DUF397 domain-containing protein n=1 Tax=Nonomuraea sp. NPDC050153 TaxID=3364359 RepID=UPI00378772C1